MLTRDQQRLLADAGAAMAANALLDRLRGRETLAGGCSAPQSGGWIEYDRKGVRLKDHSETYAAMRAHDNESPPATGGQTAWHRMKPRVVVEVTWAEAAAHGAMLPPALREELEELHRTDHEEATTWWQFSDERGGYPHRARFASDQEHQDAAAEWEQAWQRHIRVLNDVLDRRKAAVERSLPLTVDEEPVDLLELLAQQPDPGRSTNKEVAPGTLQAGALRTSPTGAVRPAELPCEELFTLPAIQERPGL